MGSGQTIIAMMGIILGVGAPIALLAMVLWYKSRKTRLAHETAIKFAEKGQPVPPELFANNAEPFSDLRRGLVLLGLGLGLSMFMYQLDAPWSLGMIPAFMGIGYLVVWKLEDGRSPHKSDRA